MYFAIPTFPVAAVSQLPDGSDIQPEANEATEGVEMALKEPAIHHRSTEADAEDLKQAVVKAKGSIHEFAPKTEMPVDQTPQGQLRGARTLNWVHTSKGFVKSRWCIRVHDQVDHHLDDTYMFQLRPSTCFD